MIDAASIREASVRSWPLAVGLEFWESINFYCTLGLGKHLKEMSLSRPIVHQCIRYLLIIWKITQVF